MLNRAKRKTIKANCPDGNKHSFQIVRGSGRRTGISTWRCTQCERKIKSS